MLTSIGCASGKETFPHRTSDQVWTAMVAAAEHPEYHDWHVLENDVWADDSGRRIEIYRLLRVYQDPSHQMPRLVDREWRFVVRLVSTKEPPAEKGGEPQMVPTVEFAVRGFHLPANGWVERDRYFEQVRKLLAGEPLYFPPEDTALPAAGPDAAGDR